MKNDKKKLIPAAIVAAAVLLGAAAYLRNHGGLASGVIRVSGNIEATDIRLSFQAAGKISELLTDEGRFVHKGDVVARLDKEELAESRQHAKTQLQAADFEYKWLKEEYDRAENLLRTGASTAQQRDLAKSRFEVAEAQLQAARASLQLAEIRLGYAELYSPVDGFILVKSAEPAEVVGIGAPVFTVVDLNDIWLTAYVNETDLGRVRLGQQVDVKTDTFPDRVYGGRVSFISQEAEFTPKQIQTTQERVKLVYRIKVVLENPNQELKPGMPADGYIKP